MPGSDSHDGLPDDEIVKAFLADWESLGSLINNRLKEHKQKFVAGTQTPTIADFACGSPYFQFLNNESSVLPPLIQGLIQSTINSKSYLKSWINKSLRPEFENHLQTRRDFPF